MGDIKITHTHKKDKGKQHKETQPICVCEYTSGIQCKAWDGAKMEIVPHIYAWNGSRQKPFPTLVVRGTWKIKHNWGEHKERKTSTVWLWPCDIIRVGNYMIKVVYKHWFMSWLSNLDAHLLVTHLL